MLSSKMDLYKFRSYFGYIPGFLSLAFCAVNSYNGVRKKPCEFDKSVHSGLDTRNTRMERKIQLFSFSLRAMKKSSRRFS